MIFAAALKQTENLFRCFGSLLRASCLPHPCHAQTRICTRTYTHKYMLAPKHTLTNTHTNANTHTLTIKHKHSLAVTNKRKHTHSLYILLSQSHPYSHTPLLPLIPLHTNLLSLILAITLLLLHTRTETFSL